MPKEQDTGELGEQIARRHLQRKGYAIVASNWSSIYGELDIVATRDGTLVFVEVKTRRSANTESALAGITPAKHERIVSAAWHYLQEHDLDPDLLWRIDVIAIALQPHRPPLIDHVEDAFDW